MTTCATKIAQVGLRRGHPASWLSKVVTSTARQTALLRADPTEGQRAEDARTKRLGTRDEHGLETKDSAADARRRQAGPRPGSNAGQ